MTDEQPPVRSELFGVDIQSGDIRGDGATFALVRFDGSVNERDTVSARKLSRLIAEHRPSIVAVDNVYELATDRDDLVRFLRELPEETALVQVTGDQRPEPLSRVARRHDVVYDSSPMGEAEASARLAAERVGYAVRAFEDATRVRVTRGRSPGKGGSSEDRFTRRIHGSVKRRAREVTDRLDDRKLTYEREVTEKYGGWSRAEFEVHAAPGELPVSAGRHGDVRIEVEPIRSDGLRFEPLANRRDRVIVGIDPGTNTAVGIVDLDGSVLDVWSSRTSDAGELIEWIVDRGRPLIVAADVETMPSTVEQVRRSFDGMGWTPEENLPVDEKLHRCREHDVANDHERDALAAALFAFDAHDDLFHRIQSKTPVTLEWQEVAAGVVGEGRSIESAVESLVETPESEQVDQTSQPAEPSPERRRITELETRVERQREYIDTLRDQLDDREDAIDDFEERIRRARSEQRRAVRREREVTRLRRENDQLERTVADLQEEVTELERKLERMKALWRLDHSNFADIEEQGSDLVPVKPVEKFTVQAIDAADTAYGLAPDDVIYLRDASGAGEAAARRLVGVEPRVVLKTGGLSDVADRILFESDVPIGSIDAVAMQEVDELAVARESDVEAEIQRWEERAVERRLEHKRKLVDDLIDEHRSGRAT